MSTKCCLILALASTSVTISAQASPYVGTGLNFVNPAGWNVGDAGSTYQAWDNLSALAGNLPDAGYTVNPPLIGTDPTLTGKAPAFATGFPVGSGNFYSYSGQYAASADIFNHGTGGADGTQVLVQTAASKNTFSAIPSSMEIVDLAGDPLTGGDNGSALVNAGLLAGGTVNSSMGPVTYEVLFWEFFLPSYTGDFRVQWTEDTDSSFDQLRVDSFLTSNALPATSFTFQQIPEPCTLAIALVGLIGALSGARSLKGSLVR